MDKKVIVRGSLKSSKENLGNVVINFNVSKMILKKIRKMLKKGK